MSLIQFWRILWSRRAIVLTTTLASFLAAVLIVNILPPRYDAVSRVELDIIKPDPVTGEVISSGFARTYMATQMELIRDYRVLGQVVDALGWTGSPELAEQFRNSSASRTQDFRRWLAELIKNRTTVRDVVGTNVIEITYGSDRADDAAKIADTIRDEYRKQTIAARRDAALENARWFEQQTEKLRRDLVAAEKRKTDFEIENKIILQEDNIDTESARLKALASAQPAQAAPMSAAQNPAVAQLAQMDAAIAQASQSLGPNHPDLQAMRRQRAAIAATLNQSAPAVSSGPSIGQLYSAQQARVLAQRGKVNEAQQLAGDVALLKDQLAKAAQRKAALEQEAASNEAGLTLLGSAVPPESASFPNVPMALFGSLGLGLGLGVLLSIFVELLNRRVRSVEDLRIENLPVIGVMARDLTVQEKRRWWQWLGFTWSPRVRAGT